MLEFFASATFVLITDQLSKLLILHHLAAGQVVILWGPLQFRRVANSRAPFGIVKSSMAFVVIWIVVSGAFIGANQFRAFSDSQVTAWGFGLAWGGATSNLFDRLWRRAIIDFIDVRLCPVFNLADAAIVIGAALAVWAVR